MRLTKEAIVAKAKEDLAGRLGINVAAIQEISVTDKEFPDMSLGTAVGDEMAAQMISSGWEILLKADEKSYQYVGDRYQLRLKGFKGKNYSII